MAYNNNDVYYNDWGFECDSNGTVLRTRYNMELEAELREEEEAAAYAPPRRGGGLSRRAPTAQQNRGRHNNYDDDDYADGIQTVYGGRNQQQPSRHESSTVSRRNAGQPAKKTVSRFDLDDDEPVRKSGAGKATNRYDDEFVDEKPKKIKGTQKSLNEEVPHFEFVKPVDGKYHDILLPAGLGQKKIYLPATLLDDDKYVVYYKREIFEKGKKMNDVDDLASTAFGEDMFKNVNFAPLALDVGAIINLNINKDDVVTIDRSTDIIDQLLMLINSTTTVALKREDEIYCSEAFIASRYFNDTGKNLLLDLVSDESFRFANMPDIMKRLEAIYDRYAKNKNTLNGISKIDKEMTASFNSYVAAYSATDKFYVNSLMKYGAEFYKAVSTSPEILDNDLRKNIINGMGAFFGTFISSINQYIKDLNNHSEQELVYPSRELIVISENSNISLEVTEIEGKENKNLFYEIDRVYTPYMHDMLTRLDKEKTLHSFNRVVFYNYKNIYTIIKCGEGKFTLSNFEKRN